MGIGCSRQFMVNEYAGCLTMIQNAQLEGIVKILTIDGNYLCKHLKHKDQVAAALDYDLSPEAIQHLDFAFDWVSTVFNSPSEYLKNEMSTVNDVLLVTGCNNEKLTQWIAGLEDMPLRCMMLPEVNTRIRASKNANV